MAVAGSAAVREIGFGVVAAFAAGAGLVVTDVEFVAVVFILPVVAIDYVIVCRVFFWFLHVLLLLLICCFCAFVVAFLCLGFPDSLQRHVVVSPSLGWLINHLTNLVLFAIK